MHSEANPALAYLILEPLHDPYLLPASVIVCHGVVTRLQISPLDTHTSLSVVLTLIDEEDKLNETRKQFFLFR